VTLAFSTDSQKGFVEAHSDDGLLEIFGLKEGWHASFVMAELIKAKHIAQVLYFCGLSFCIICQAKHLSVGIIRVISNCFVVFTIFYETP
jgi:hypothetical protein